MSEKGWQKVNFGGDVILTAVGSTQNQQGYQTFYDGMGGWRWGGLGDLSTTTVQYIRVGTLVLDMYTTATNTNAAQNLSPESTSSSGLANPSQEPMAPLFADDECRNLRSRWESLQVGFVDEPRRAVEQADQLVTEAIHNLSKGFSGQREQLEQQWHRDQNVSTEDLRLAFQRYRSFFDRLLSL